MKDNLKFQYLKYPTDFSIPKGERRGSCTEKIQIFSQRFLELICHGLLLFLSSDSTHGL